MMVNGVKEKLKGRFSYFNLANLEGQLDEKYRKIFSILTPNLHIALARIAEKENINVTVNLSSREREILQLVSKGLRNSEIASILSISIYTVKNHIRAIFQKIGANCRTQAVLIANENKIIT